MDPVNVLSSLYLCCPQNIKKRIIKKKITFKRVNNLYKHTFVKTPKERLVTYRLYSLAPWPGI
jgi:hypothetical protein